MSRIGRIFLFVLASVLLSATPVLAYLYRAPIAITENASNNYTMLPVLWDQNNTWLANNGFMASTANDTRVQTLGGLNRPWLVADNKTLTAVSVPANSQTNLYFVTGESAASAMDIIVGYGGYITTPDDPTLEVADNFSIETSGWIDTTASANKTLAYKRDAFVSFVSPDVSGNVTSGIATLTLINSESGISNTQVTSIWQTFTTGVGKFDATSVSLNLTINGALDTLTVGLKATSGGSPTGAYLTSTTGAEATGWVVFDFTDVELDANTQYAIDISSTGSGPDFNLSVVNPYNGGRASTAVGDDLYFRVNGYDYGDTTVSATGISSGEHTITTSLFTNSVVNSDFETGSPPSNWTIGVGAFTRSNTQVKYGAYSGRGVSSAGDICWVYQDLPNPQAITKTYGVWIWTNTANRAFLRIDDSAGSTVSAYHPGDSTWRFITVTRAMNGVSEQLSIRIQPGSVTAYFDGIVDVVGTGVLSNPPFSILVDGDQTGSYLFETSSVNVTNTSNNWTFIQNNVMPYANSISISVNGTEALRYEPTSMIIGATLPDEAGVNDGVITWGANPAGVGVTLGSMSSSGQPSIGAASDTSTNDLLPVVGGRDWRPDAGVSAALQANPLRPIVTAISDNTTLTEYQVWVWFGGIFVVLVLAFVASRVRGHHLITGIAVTAAIILLVVWTIFPWWTLVLAALAIVFGLISERSPSL